MSKQIRRKAIVAHGKEALSTLPKIVINPFCHELIRRCHKQYKNLEWSGIARLEKRDWYYVMTDIVFGKQENSWTLTTITEEGVNEIGEKIFDNGLPMGEYNCWLHSHHSMAVFWSGTDDAQKQSFDSGGRKHFFHVVTNYRWADCEPWYKGALTFYHPQNIEFEVDVEVGGDYDDCIELCGDVKPSIEQMKDSWNTELDSVAEQVEKLEADKIEASNKLRAELELEYKNLDEQPLESIISEEEYTEMLEVLNLLESDPEVIKSIIYAGIDEKKKELLDNLASSMDEKISDLEDEYDTKVALLTETINDKWNTSVNELIEACLPFETKLSELIDCANRGKRSVPYSSPMHTANQSYAWEKGKDRSETWGYRENREREREGRLFNGWHSYMDDPVIQEHYNMTGNVITPASVDVWDYIDDIANDNMATYRYDHFMYRAQKTFFRPKGFEQFEMNYVDGSMKINGEHINVVDIYDIIIKKKGWRNY